MNKHIPTEQDLLEALEKKRKRADRVRRKMEERCAAEGKRIMTAELAREIRDFAEVNPDMARRALADHFDVKYYMVSKVLNRTTFPNA